MKSTQMCRLWRNFSETSRAIAREKGLETTELAKRAGLSRSSVYYYWAGSMAPKLESIEAVAAALGVEPQVLLADPDTIDVKDIVASTKPTPVQPEKLLSKNKRTALALGERIMKIKNHDRLLRVCESAPARRIRAIIALLED